MRTTLLILGSLFSSCAFAGIYKCTDVTGKINYQSKPCDQAQKTEQINVKTGGSSDPEQGKQVLEQKEQDDKLQQELLLRKETQLKQEAANESAKNQFLIKNNPEKFSAFSIPPYVHDQLPDVVKNYQNRLPEIERLRRQAAEKALATGLCIRVESSELHSQSTKKALVFLVSCSNGKTFYFSEQELVK
ncbi:MAG: DUF4124 domain-containing protein [Methylobacter sp.]|nr:DUF4124 domain-containing protein [Methylobacter sp.]